MEIKKIETKTVEQAVVVGVECDVCKKRITGKYWTVCTGNRDWGNDSCDSIENYDLCSIDCVNKKVEEYFHNCDESDTQYFELEQDFFPW